MHPRPPKRSHPPRSHHPHSQSSRSGPSTSSSSTSTNTQIPPIAYVQAYEAQLVYSQDEMAREVTQRGGRSGMGLIRYAGEVDGHAEDGEDGGREREVWIDRHDILHLLPSITLPPTLTQILPSPASSSSSWDSLPSDLEETFYLSDPEEIAAYEQEKKKKWIEALRRERLKEREREDEESGVNANENRWDEDEEPPAPILALMQHTSRAIFSSPNPSVLELRILTNHAKDERFEFLKGRYKSTWERIKGELRKGKQVEQREREKVKGIGLGYDSSDDTDSDEEDGVGDIPPPPPPPPEDDEVDEMPPPPPEHGSVPPTVVQDHTPPPSKDNQISIEGAVNEEEEKKRIRRLRMEEWKRKRAVEKAS
ncbi:hypothetical protein I302_105796 [Kwoniella bestiolae CBS 10118]|uniref:SURP motif domain-containing protein n=1 Tax=Kwoniella bestiolae CBS 10118 TaxID=1296100 RepID=A0A1B9G252_9TREE|nr:hypothetical protein I302_04917 [Kwoniella bestiolae CBS 10118]OCF25107.1 hypothetical protein I302_04917 [Kwoniella bestiolae CBS 10118]